VTAPDRHALGAAPQDGVLHEHADSATGRRRDGGSGDAEARKRTEAEDEARIEADVDRVRNPQHAHRDRRVAGAAKDRDATEWRAGGRARAEKSGRDCGQRISLAE